MMSKALLTDVSHRYGLGTPVAPSQAVIGGLLHRMYRLETKKGCFAVKVLNPDIMQKPGIRDEFRRAEHIAAMFADAGLPAITALAVESDTIQDVGEATVIVFPWVEGKMLSPQPASVDQAHRIGMVLGLMHTLNLQIPGLPIPEFHTYPNAHWEALIWHAHDSKRIWADKPESLLADLYAWNRLARQGYEGVRSHWVVSHGDLDQKNVLWREDHTPWLIDWESVGLVNPALEVIGAVLSWSGQTVGPPEQTVFAALLRGYRNYADLPADVGRAALQGCIGNCLHWLEPNMRRSLPDAGADAEGQKAGLREVEQTLTLLRALAANISVWATWC